MNTEQLRSIQGLFPEIVSGVLASRDLWHFQNIFRPAGDEPTSLTENQLWSIQTIFPTGLTNLRDLRHYQGIFRVDLSGILGANPSAGLQYTLPDSRLHFTLPYD